ncbi:GNAT family N-acetyltransferase [Sphingobacterium sp. DR205]|uniref:GNAT family N-acetyltransferase n=2 Tax=Sphingobacterium athyrii TaxID=2152717 RepID=A0A363P0Y6_9SPHI|nr:GNAT family N-acetyltransferase [Sphingobacterium sp. DR205]PUV26581.1 GNAT family N-acetyltransferase [Sphingobacterium athyrii]QIH33801.1 GNAT family N-acetyltransferase [Sphingobacterium sp. DR205]
MIVRAAAANLIQADNVLEEVKTHMSSQGIDQWDQEYPNKDTLAADIERKEGFVYVDQGQILAYMALNERHDEEYNDLSWETPVPFLVIHRLYVKPSAQGKGISSQMIRYAEQYALENQYKSIRFDAFSLNNQANTVYLKKGYKFVGTVSFRKGIFNCYEKEIYTV